MHAVFGQCVILLEGGGKFIDLYEDNVLFLQWKSVFWAC